MVDARTIGLCEIENFNFAIFVVFVLQQLYMQLSEQEIIRRENGLRALIINLILRIYFL
jgi:hypothetical protein